MAKKITRDILEGYLHCKTKAHLKLAGQQGSVSDYEKLLVASRQEVRQEAISKILARHPESEVARGISLTAASLQVGRAFILETILVDGRLELCLDGLKRVEGPSKLGGFSLYSNAVLRGTEGRKGAESAPGSLRPAPLSDTG